MIGVMIDQLAGPEAMTEEVMPRNLVNIHGVALSCEVIWDTVDYSAGQRYQCDNIDHLSTCLVQISHKHIVWIDLLLHRPDALQVGGKTRLLLFLRRRIIAIDGCVELGQR